ncbi:hypothetical protein Dimus_035715 [Dionaea muscipula]
MGMDLQSEIVCILKRRALVAGREKKNNGVVRIFVLRENIGGRSVEVRISEAGGELGKRPDSSWHLLIQLETLEEHGLAAVKHPRMEEIFGIYMDCRHWKRGRPYWGRNRKWGRVVYHSGGGDDSGADGSLSGSKKAKVVVPTNRGGEAREVAKKGVASGEKGDVKEVVAKTQAVQGADQGLSERGDTETGHQPRAEDVDPIAMNEVMEVFERDESLMASLAGGPMPLNQQKWLMAMGEENMRKEPAAIAQSIQGKESAAFVAQIVTEKGKCYTPCFL